MKNALTYLSVGIAVFSISLSMLLISLNGVEDSKIVSLQQEIDDLKAHLETPNGRGTVSQQSISKMSPSIASMTNEDANPNPMEERLEKVESDIVDIRSKMGSFP